LDDPRKICDNDLVQVLRSHYALSEVVAPDTFFLGNTDLEATKIVANGILDELQVVVTIHTLHAKAELLDVRHLHQNVNQLIDLCKGQGQRWLDELEVHSECLHS